MGIVLTVADADHVDAGFSVADVARVVVGAAFAGAVFGAAGALAGAVARHPGDRDGRRRGLEPGRDHAHARRHDGTGSDRTCPFSSSGR